MKYQEKDVIDRLQQVENFDLLYQQDFLNWTGCTSDTQKSYSEVIARELLSDYNKQKLCDIGREFKARKGSYNLNHNGKLPKNIDGANLKEKHLAIALFNASKDEGYEFPFGKIIDYQTPLKRVRDDKWGEIDLLAYDGEKNSLMLIELKPAKSKETFLRSVLEIFTYYKQIINFRERFLSDFKECGVSREARIVTGILVYKGSTADLTRKQSIENCYQYKLARYLFEESFKIYLHDITEINKPPKMTCAGNCQ